MRTRVAAICVLGTRQRLFLWTLLFSSHALRASLCCLICNLYVCDVLQAEQR